MRVHVVQYESLQKYKYLYGGCHSAVGVPGSLLEHRYRVPALALRLVLLLYFDCDALLNPAFGSMATIDQGEPDATNRCAIVNALWFMH